MTVRGGSGGFDGTGSVTVTAASVNAILAGVATLPGAGSFFEAPSIWLAWSNTPVSATHAATSPNQTGASAQTALVDDFSMARAVRGSGKLKSTDIINAVKIAAIAKASSTANNINLGSLRYRSNGADTDYDKTLTTSDAYYESSLFTDTYANLLAAEAGWNKRASTAAGTQTVEDIWVIVSYTPSSTQSGTAALAGIGSLSGSASLVLAALAQLPGSGSLSAATTAKMVAAATLPGAGSLSGLGVLSLSAQASFPGSGTLSANLLTYIFDAAELLAGVGSLSATATLLMPVTASLAGTGSFSALGALAERGLAQLNGAGTLAADTLHSKAALATLPGAGSLSALAALLEAAAATLPGSGTLAADASHFKAALAALPGASTLSVDLLRFIFLTGERFDGIGSLSADATVRSGAGASTAELDGLGSLAATAALALNASAAFAGAGSLSALSQLKASALASLPGAGSLSADTRTLIGGFATLPGTGTLTASLQTFIFLTSELLAGAGSLSATARLSLTAAATLPGAGALSAAATGRLAGSAVVAGAGSLSAAPAASLTAAATLAGAGTLSANLLLANPPGTAHLDGIGILSATARLRMVAAAGLDGAGSLSALAALRLPVSAALAGAGDINALAGIVRFNSATFVGAGGLAAAADIVHPTDLSALLLGSGGVAAYANLTVAAAAALGGTGRVFANLTLVRFTGLVFPEFLRARLLFDGYGHQRARAAVRTNMESGFDRVRLTDRSPLRTMTAVIDFTAEQSEYFNAWYEYVEKSGEIWFRIPLPIEGSARAVLARFVGEPTQRPLNAVADRWRLAAQFEINDPNVVARGVFSRADDGIFPSDILGNAILADDYSHKRAAAGDRSDQALEGTPQFRTRTLTPFRSIALSWWWDDDQVAFFNEWLEYRGRHEASFFTIDVPIDNASYRPVRARFASPPKISAVAPSLWKCTAELEARDINSLTPDDFTAVAEFLEEIPYLQEMNDAIDDLTLDPFFDAWDDVP